MRIAAVTAALLALVVAGQGLAQTPAPAKPAPAAPAKPVPAAPAKPVPAKDAPSPLLGRAQAGDAQAQYQLGMAYLTGKGMKRDAAEGLSWLALAASGGEVAAAVEVARAYEGGRGVRKDAAEAARWWFRAGKLGNADARKRFIEMFLADITDDDLGGAEVAEWLSHRATEGDAEAVLGLAGMYERGRGVAPDAAEAERWYLTLALAGHAEAQFRLGRMMLGRPSLWRLPDTEFKDGQWGGPVWYAVKPEDDTRAYLGRPGMLPAERWLTAAARQGHAEAQYLLGMALITGIDLPFSLEDGVRWLTAAAERQHPAALIAVADLAAKGQGFPGKDPVRAWVELDFAAQAGRKDAAQIRDQLAATLSARQLGRARQLAQDVREARGM